MPSACSKQLLKRPTMACIFRSCMKLQGRSSQSLLVFVNAIQKISASKATGSELGRNTLCDVCLGCHVRCGCFFYALDATKNTNSNSSRGFAQRSSNGANRSFAPRKASYFVRGRTLANPSQAIGCRICQQLAQSMSFGHRQNRQYGGIMAARMAHVCG